MSNPTAIRTLGLAVMVIITMAGFVAATQMPLIGALVLSVAALPAFLVILAWGGLWFLLYSALTMTLTSLVATPSAAIMLMPLILMPAAFLYGAVKVGLAPLRAMCLALLSATLFSTGMWAVTNQVSSSDGLLPVREQFANQIAVVEKQLDKIQEKGQESQESVELIRENIREVFDYTVLLIPATFLFVWHLLTLGIFYAGAVRLAPRFGFQIATVPPFTDWRFDWHLIWLFLGGWLLFYVVGADETMPMHGFARTVGANCLAVSSIMYYIAGLSLIFFMFEKYKLGPFARVGLSCMALVFTQAVVWFGIIDVWADFRTPKPALFQASDDSDDDF
ncbi:MAG TPA: DUF2232 domain-containing protein [Candidatus Rifleibacterium sp.]|jgi:hypothetical protein|nr:DUF2232 domain-containing protein [Candidatus Rifleibacterium sp.]HPW59706.1 DUF2232 domain-containing protein [Candidatus Rifleibacterium sp.]